MPLAHLEVCPRPETVLQGCSRNRTIPSWALRKASGKVTTLAWWSISACVPPYAGSIARSDSTCRASLPLWAGPTSRDSSPTVAGAALVPCQHDPKTSILRDTHQQRIEPGSREPAEDGYIRLDSHGRSLKATGRPAGRIPAYRPGHRRTKMPKDRD